jgi:ribonuclease HII
MSRLLLLALDPSLSLPNKVLSKTAYKVKFFEKTAWKDGFYVCGIDEVGRGCLAGPLVVAACILPVNTKYSLKDSKILTEAERDRAYIWIVDNCCYSVAIVSPGLVDRLNIYNATLLAMKKAFVQIIELMPIKFELLRYLLIDAMPLKLDSSCGHELLETHYFPYGETVSPSIAAASIVAKVTRDRLMQNYEAIFPGFALAQHKGYGTRTHLQNISNRGITIIHRTSFITEIINYGSERKSQQSII